MTNKTVDQYASELIEKYPEGFDSHITLGEEPFKNFIRRIQFVRVLYPKMGLSVLKEVVEKLYNDKGKGDWIWLTPAQLAISKLTNFLDTQSQKGINEGQWQEVTYTIQKSDIQGFDVLVTNGVSELGFSFSDDGEFQGIF